MINFEFSNTTEIVFGKGTQEQVGEKIRKYSDCNKVLVVYGSDRIKKNGLFDAVSSSLKQQKIDILELGGVKPNPRLSLVRRGIEISAMRQLILSLRSVAEVLLTLRKQSVLVSLMREMSGIFILVKIPQRKP